MSPRRDPFRFQTDPEYAKQIEERQETEERIDAKIISTREKEKRIPKVSLMANGFDKPTKPLISSIIKPPLKNWMVDTEAEAEKELGYQAIERMESHKTAREEGYLKYVKNVEQKEAELSQIARTTRIRARYKESKGDPITAGHLYTQSAFWRFVKGGYSTLVSYTMPHRYGETAESIYKGLTQPVKTIQKTKLKLQTDPEVAFEVAGGLTASYGVSKLASWIATKIKPKEVDLTTYKGKPYQEYGLSQRTAPDKFKFSRTQFDPDLPPRYIKMGGEWFRTGEGLTQDPSQSIGVPAEHLYLIKRDQFRFRPKGYGRIGSYGKIGLEKVVRIRLDPRSVYVPPIALGKASVRQTERQLDRQIQRAEPAQVMKQVERLREKEMFDYPQRLEPWQDPIMRLEQPQVQEPITDPIVTVDFPPITFPYQVQYPRRVQLQKPIMKPLQQLIPKTQIPTYQIPREFLKKRTRIPRIDPLGKKKRKPVSWKKLFTGEKRAYRIKDPRKFLEDIF